MTFNPDFNRRLSKVERFFHQVCLYLGISFSGIPGKATRSLDNLFRLLASIKPIPQYAAEIKALRVKTNQQAAAILW